MRIYAIVFIAAGIVLSYAAWHATRPASSGNMVSYVPPDAAQAHEPRESSIQSVHSPDGSWTATRTIAPGDAAGESIMTLAISSGGEKKYRVLETKGIPTDMDAMLPANSWSPDNRHIFVMYRTAAGLSVDVYRADGQAFSDGSFSVSLSHAFREKLPDGVIRDVTGWDDPSLLHVMTYETDGRKGPSYRFDIHGRNFYTLSYR